MCPILPSIESTYSLYKCTMLFYPGGANNLCFVHFVVSRINVPFTRQTFLSRWDKMKYFFIDNVCTYSLYKCTAPVARLPARCPVACPLPGCMPDCPSCTVPARCPLQTRCPLTARCLLITRCPLLTCIPLVTRHSNKRKKV